jgi:hypothetical protein
MQQATRLFGTVSPPQAFGTTWSMVGLLPSSSPQ